MSVVRIEKSYANGIVMAPPSKSYAHRLLIASFLSDADSVVRNVHLSADIKATINCIKAFNKEVVFNDNTIELKKKDALLNDELFFDCLESGSTLRFFIPIACLYPGKKIFKGSERLVSRGISVYEDIFKKQGISLVKNKDSFMIDGKLKSGDFYVDANVSSQFISGLLFALPLLEGDSYIYLNTEIESRNYIDITLDVLKKSGIDISFRNNVFYIKGNQRYNLLESVVEGDYSNSAFLDAYNYFNGYVLVNGLNEFSYQGDKVYLSLMEKLNKGYCEIDLKDCIDLGPILFCFSALKYGAKFINTKRLKIKESDRVSDLAEELNKFGVEVIDFGNEIIINNKDIHAPNKCLDGKNDHRIVMALTLMLSVYGGYIDGVDAVKKSYPNFFEEIKRIGIDVNYE